MAASNSSGAATYKTPGKVSLCVDPRLPLQCLSRSARPWVQPDVPFHRLYSRPAGLWAREDLSTRFATGPGKTRMAVVNQMPYFMLRTSPGSRSPGGRSPHARCDVLCGLHGPHRSVLAGCLHDMRGIVDIPYVHMLTKRNRLNASQGLAPLDSRQLTPAPQAMLWGPLIGRGIFRAL
jgi:hypothetical protein